MERNLDRRIEALFPVTDVELQARVLEVLRAQSGRRHQLVGPRGQQRLEPGPGLRGHQRPAARLQELAREAARRRREPETLGGGPG